MWGKLFASKTGRTVGGWLVDSWSENGAPCWHPQMHWFDKKEDKIYLVQLSVDWGRSAMKIYGEDTSLEPDRAKFILETVSKWEEEWLAEEAKKL